MALALVLAGIGIEESLTDTDRAYWARIVPDTSYMGTSPVAQEMIKETQGSGSGQTAQTAASPEKKEVQPVAKEAGTAPTTKGAPPPNVSTGVLEGYSDVIVIDKIGAVLPIIQADTFNVASLHTDLDSGVVLYPASAPFGEDGQTVILGHSAPDNWPQIKHDTAFSRIDELVAGDMIIVYYGEKVYDYTVTRTEIIAKGGDLSGAPPDGNSLDLVTCWPPGHDQKRIVVESTLTETE